MKNITVEEYNAAPQIIKRMYWLAMNKLPVSLKMFNEAKERYPEYFED